MLSFRIFFLSRDRMPIIESPKSFQLAEHCINDKSNHQEKQFCCSIKAKPTCPTPLHSIERKPRTTDRINTRTGNTEVSIISKSKLPPSKLFQVAFYLGDGSTALEENQSE